MLEVFGFLNRNDLEICQMVSRTWNQRIFTWTRGPIRPIYISHIPARTHFWNQYSGFSAYSMRRLCFSETVPYMRKSSSEKNLGRAGIYM